MANFHSTFPKFEGRLSCFMWQRSYFYNKARLATHGWDLRWFNFFPDMITSVPDRSDADQHKVVYPWFEQVDIDESRMIIRIVNPKENRRNYYLMAPSREIMDAVVKKLEEILELRSAATEEDKKEAETEALEVLGDDFHDEAEVSLIEYPTGSSAMVKFFFIFLYPFRFLMHWTVPDVKSTDGNGMPTAKLSTAYLNVFMCLVWLVIGSYAMVSSLEHLADMMKVPTAVVGVTVSAAGTSLPNYVASKIAAEKGFGVSIVRLFIFEILKSTAALHFWCILRIWPFRMHLEATHSILWSVLAFRGLSIRVSALDSSLITDCVTKEYSTVSSFLRVYLPSLSSVYCKVVLCFTNSTPIFLP